MLHQIQKRKYFSPRLSIVFAQSTEARWSVENEDIFRAAPEGGAPITSERFIALENISEHLKNI